LDHLDDLKLPEPEVNDHYDARMALARLGEGLSWIHGVVAEVERQTRTEAEKENTPVVVVAGVLEGKPIGILSCAFQWYAVSACNYAQLVGWLATRDPRLTKEYVGRVMPRLLKYRNKVAAHFALTDPLRDNEADLAASVMTQIVYAQGRLCAAALTPIVLKEAQEITASRDLSWSLTLAHERLVPRYWPAGPPKSFQGLKVLPGRTTFNLSWADLLG
jgi:hypothetical protein